MAQGGVGAKVSIPMRNYFMNRMKDKDPTLNIGKNAEQKQGIKTYGKTCQHRAQDKKQPVILDDNEKKKLDKISPNSYAEALDYKTPMGKKFWYICPRYWDVHNNMSLSEEIAQSNDYKNKILKKTDKKTTSNAYIYSNENTNKTFNEYPYLLNTDEYYPPCCGKKKIHKLTKQDQKKNENYILGFDKENLDEGRLAYLPIAISNLLSQKQSNSHTLDPQKLYVLRQGVEHHKTQSFLGVLADLLSTDKKQYSIEDIKQQIIKKIDLDTFITLQNGSLISIFKDKHVKKEDSLLDLFKTTLFYKNTDMNNPLKKNMFLTIANSYTNFIAFLNSEEKIDYSYLWDIISKKKGLFINGINLILLELVNDDITDKINIICPSNSFSGEPYSINKDTTLIIKQDDKYEPIYLVEYLGDAKSKPATATSKSKSSKNTISISKFFKKNTKPIPEINKIINKIIKNIQDHCSPRPIPILKHYDFVRNKQLKEVIEILNSLNYIIVNQVLNYNSKIIALMVQSKTEKRELYYVPCYPSNILIDMATKDVKLIWISEVKWNQYKKTKEFLEELASESNNAILCRPRLKVIEKNNIVGIITETNQYVKVEPAVTSESINDELTAINYKYIDVNLINNDYLEADKISLTGSPSNTLSDLDKINYEKKLYNSFRNTIRILLSSIKIKITSNYSQTIVEIIKNTSLNYFEKSELIIKELKTLTNNYITFFDISYDDYKSYNRDEITSCVNKMSCKNKFFCDFDERTKICKLKLPQINFYTNTNNEDYYYERVADELIRYNRIRDFILSQRSFLNFSSIRYNLKNNELLIIESKLNDEFLNSLVPIDIYNNDVIPYDLINPSNIRKNKILKELQFKDFDSVAYIPNDPSQVTFNYPDPNTSLSTKFIPKTNAAITQTELKDKSIPMTLLTSKISHKESSKPLELQEITSSTKKNKEFNFINCSIEQDLQSYSFFNEPMRGKVFNVINSALCSYQLIIEIINHTNKTSKTIITFQKIKKNLITIYNDLFKNELHKKIILSLWNTEGKEKEELSTKIASNAVTIDTSIMEDDYFITTTDFMLLANLYKLPIVLLSNETFNDFSIHIESLNLYLLINKETPNPLLTNIKKIKTINYVNYYYIYVAKNNDITNYKLFYTNKKESKIPEQLVNVTIINSIKLSNSYISTIVNQL